MTLAPRQASWSATWALLHPLWWASLIVLAVNDHVLKGAHLLPPAVTGKLSDFAGLLMAPALVAVLVAPRRRAAFDLAHVVVGIAFGTLKISDDAAAAWSHVGAALGLTWKIVADPTDLIALPMLLASRHLFGPRLDRHRLPGTWHRLAIRVAIATGLLSVMATSRLPPRHPMLVAPNSVYVGEGSRLKELDRATGRLRRDIDFDLRWGNQPKLLGDSLYAGHGSFARGYDLATGRLRWERELRSWFEIAHVDDHILIARSEDAAWALDPRTGQLLFRIDAPNERVVTLNDRIVLQGPDGKLSFFARTDGKPIANSASEATYPAALGSMLYAFAGGRVVEVDLLGVVRRRSDVSFEEPRWAWPRSEARVLLVSFPGDRKTASREGSLVGVDPLLMRELWRLPGERVLEAVNDLVLTEQGLLCGESTLVARDAVSGRARWSAPWCGWHSSVRADEGIVVTFLRENGEVTARDPVSGRVRWTARVGD